MWGNEMCFQRRTVRRERPKGDDGPGFLFTLFPTWWFGWGFRVYFEKPETFTSSFLSILPAWAQGTIFRAQSFQVKIISLRDKLRRWGRYTQSWSCQQANPHTVLMAGDALSVGQPTCPSLWFYSPRRAPGSLPLPATLLPASCRPSQRPPPGAASMLPHGFIHSNPSQICLSCCHPWTPSVWLWWWCWYLWD